MKNIIEQKGQKYLKIGDKAIPFDKFDKKGKPIIKPVIEKKKNKKGGTDITVKIPCLLIRTKANQLN